MAQKTSDENVVPAQMYFDTIIIGAGISGINAAYRIQSSFPSMTYAILEGRTSIGGTWDLFKYPGIRSDSDIFTFGLPWSPWDRQETLAAGGRIKDYLIRSARSVGIDKNIRYSHKVGSANWLSGKKCWEVKASVAGQDQLAVFHSRFVLLGTGYYDYETPLQTEIPGINDFEGEVIHPQFWPSEYDYAGKEIVIIGSGATAITLLPSLASKAKRVTMLQRSPGYVFSVPQTGLLASLFFAILPASLARQINRALWIFWGLFTTQICQMFPDAAKKKIRENTIKQLPEHIKWDPHFKPQYNPWEQRFCACLDGDFFEALRCGKGEIVTDKIQTVTNSSIELMSGASLRPDVIITATGLKLKFGGGIKFSLDGNPVDITSKFTWKSAMLQDVPNLIFITGLFVMDHGSTIIERPLPSAVKYDLSTPGHVKITLPPASTWSSGLHWHETHDEYLKVIKGGIRVRLGNSWSVIKATDSEQPEIKVNRYVWHEWKRAEPSDEVVVIERTEPEDDDKALFFWNLNGVILSTPKLLEDHSSFLSRLPVAIQPSMLDVWIMLQLFIIFAHLDNFPVFLDLALLEKRLADLGLPDDNFGANTGIGLREIDSSEASDAEPSTDAQRVDPVSKLVDMTGQLSFTNDGQIRYFGSLSNYNLLHGRMNEVPGTRPAATADWDPSAPLMTRNGSMVSFELQSHLLDLYWRWQNPWSFIVHKEAFIQDYLHDKSGKYCSPMLLFSIFAVASRYSDRVEIRSDPDNSKTAGLEFGECAKAYLQQESEAPTLTTVQSVALLALSSMSADREALGWLYVGMAVRMAFNLGLNLDMSSWVKSGSISEFEAEVRSVTWWGCFRLDKLFAMGQGRPSMTRQADMTCPRLSQTLPAEYEPWVPWSAKDEALRGMPARTASAASYTSDLLLIAGDALDKIYAPNARLSYGEIENVITQTDVTLHEFYVNLPSFLRLPTSTRQPILPHIYQLQ
ncbi:FAD-containing monooxygenase EthA [Paramyrothecium foliicola]|nr:FAD-containing monooxygenase EthA [Paramyrothecium foliicola]